MSQSLKNRVSEAIKGTNKKVTKLSQEVGVSRKTIYRWRDKGTDKFDEEVLKALAKSLGLNYKWLEHGIGPKYEDERLNQIESAVNDAGANYKGLDQTISNVESKAKNLKQDLQSLIDDLKKLRSGS